MLVSVIEISPIFSSGGCDGVAFLVWSSVDILCCGSKWFLQSENLSCKTEKRNSFLKVNKAEQICAGGRKIHDWPLFRVQ